MARRRTATKTQARRHLHRILPGAADETALDGFARTECVLCAACQVVAANLPRALGAEFGVRHPHHGRAASNPVKVWLLGVDRRRIKN